MTNLAAGSIGGGHLSGSHLLISVNLSSLFSSDDPHAVAVAPQGRIVNSMPRLTLMSSRVRTTEQTDLK